jgi:hypothetical protein
MISRARPLSTALLCSAALAAACHGNGDDDEGRRTREATNKPPATFQPPFSTVAFADQRIDSDGALPTFQRARGVVDFGTEPVAKATLLVDLGTTCFPFESWQQNKPPEGHTFPADCDAFDRNFEITLDEPKADGEPQALELVRAITPFGGPLHLEVDVTDIVNGRPGQHELQAYIATWSDAAGLVTGSKGGWTVSARIDVEPGNAPRKVLAVIPVVNGNIGSTEGNTVLTSSFTLPEGTTRTRIEHRVTGHGQGRGSARDCVGPAEEFCKRTHTVQIDGVEIDAPVPWIESCEDHCTLSRYGSATQGFEFCKESPTGNIASVRAPRANWCPGTMSAPFFYERSAVPGAHVFGYGVKARIPEGGSWRVSTTIIAYGD